MSWQIPVHPAFTDEWVWLQVKIVLKEVTNVQYCACMNPTAGSFNITPRMQRHFVTFAVQMPSAEIVRYAAAPATAQSASSRLVNGTVALEATKPYACSCLQLYPTLAQHLLWHPSSASTELRPGSLTTLHGSSHGLNPGLVLQSACQCCSEPANAVSVCSSEKPA